MLSGFGQVFKSDLHRSYLRPSAEQVSAWGGRNDPRDAREKKPVVPRVGIWGPLLEACHVLDIFHTFFVCVFDGIPRARSRLGSWGRVTGNLLGN